MSETKTENTAPTEDFSAELLILEDMGVSEEKLSRINSAAAAKRLIAYYEKKANAKPEQKEDKKENTIKIPHSAGHKPSALPEPEETTQQRSNQLPDKLNELSPLNLPDGARRNSASRILVLFDEQHPEGRVF